MNKTSQKLHFIGIGGSGMAPLAELAHQRGFFVQGSDEQQNDNTKRLQALGINVFNGHTPQHLSNVNTVIYSSAIKGDNPEFTAAQKQKLAVLHRSDFLAQMMTDHFVITVAGTHGKTTTAAMITHMLDGLGLDPTAIVGGEMLSYESGCRMGKSQYFVAEADESDGSFLKYQPNIAIINNIDVDHLDFFASKENIQSIFLKHLATIKEDGIAIIGWDHELSRQVGWDYHGNRLTFGSLIGCDSRLLEYKTTGFYTTYRAVIDKELVTNELEAIGHHNVLNVLTALTVAKALQLNITNAAQCLKSFKGVKRRLNCHYTQDQILLYDDYAHNPGKIGACLKTLKENWPDYKLVVLFQPHRYSRLETMYKELLSAFKCADLVYILPVYSAGEQASKEFSLETLAADMTTYSKVLSHPVKEIRQALTLVSSEIKPKTLLLTLGAGNVSDLINDIKGLLSAKKKAKN